MEVVFNGNWWESLKNNGFPFSKNYISRVVAQLVSEAKKVPYCHKIEDSGLVFATQNPKGKSEYAELVRNNTIQHWQRGWCFSWSSKDKNIRIWHLKWVVDSDKIFIYPATAPDV